MGDGKTVAPTLSVNAPEMSDGMGVAQRVRLEIEFSFVDIVRECFRGHMWAFFVHTRGDKAPIAEAAFLYGELFQVTSEGSYSGATVAPPLTIAAATAHLRAGIFTLINGIYRFDRLHLLTVP